MKTPRYQLTVRAVAAAAIALAGSFSAVPALAETGGTEPAPSAPPSVAAGAAPAAASAPGETATASAPAPGGAATEISDAGLAEAVRRDLGMTLKEFNAAGQLARTAADALPSLRQLPGYVGISLRNGRIVVEGSGAELQARVDELNGPGTAAVFDLVAPAPQATAATSSAPSTAPSAAASPAPSAAASKVPSAAASPAPSAAPSKVPSAADLVASNTDQLFDAYVREVGPAGLQAVAYSGGRFIIRTGGTNAAEAGPAQSSAQPTAPAPATTSAPVPAKTAPAPATTAPAPATTTAPAPATTATTPTAPTPGKISPADFVSRYANVQLEQGSPVATEADVYGGDGYVIEAGYWRTICSTGFGAYSAAGLPIVLTAGHCAEDGTATVSGLEPPTSATAGGSAPLPGTLLPLGSFGFSQFGGPLNSWITGTEGAPGNVGTDIAVIEGINGGVNLQAAATTWANPANPGATAVKIVGTVAPFQGQDVCRSGRTAGWSCGQVDETGIYVVGGRTTAPEDLRAFRGFLSKNVQSSGGDSGGPWISGNFAVGTHSAGERQAAPGEPPVPNFAIATTLEDSMAQIPGGVQLQLFLNKPELAAPDAPTVRAGQPITGRVPAAPASAVAANSKVRITVNKKTTEVPVDADGNWAYPAPATTGKLTITAETVNGFSRSGAVTLTVSVTNLDAPVITTPAEGAALKTLTRIGGTGTPGLTVKLTGDISGSAIVAADGRWSIPVDGPAPGNLSIHAVQTSPGEADSPAVTRNFTLAPAAPAVTTIGDGSHFSQDALPGTIAGTGIDGAQVAVLIDGQPAGTVPAGARGAWSVPFPAGIVPGEHTLSATQTVDGVASDPLLVTFSVDAPAVAPTPAPAGPVAPAEQPTVLPAGSVQMPDAGSGELADTGAGSLLPTAGLAGGAVLLGGLLLAGVQLAGSRRRAVR